MENEAKNEVENEVKDEVLVEKSGGNIIHYAHVAEILDRVIIESLKVPEFLNKSQLFVGDNEEAVQKASQHAIRLAKVANDTARQQEGVLQERLAFYENGDVLTSLLIAVAQAAISTATVARFENLKRQEHSLNEQKDLRKIANWDSMSRDACETRAFAKSQINEMLAKLIPGYEYPRETRTF